MLLLKETRIGVIGMEETDGHITHVYLRGEKAPEDAPRGETPLLGEAFDQLERYLDGALREFSLPLRPEGTPFMRRVWQALCQVAYGVTASYKDIAVAIGSPKACRAVGMANNKNPIPIFIPCHRIIGADGKLVGYGGGLDIKRFLLALEARQGMLQRPTFPRLGL